MKTKQILFFRAHEIRRSTKVSISEALKKAWAVLKLAKTMKDRIVEFAYRKVDGSIRMAKGTLNIDRDQTAARPFNTKVQTYFDVEANDFRCFKVENLILVA